MPAKTRKASSSTTANAITSSKKKTPTRGRGRPRKTAKENQPAASVAISADSQTEPISVEEKNSNQPKPLPVKTEQLTLVAQPLSSKEGESNPNQKQLVAASEAVIPKIDPKIDPKTAIKLLFSSTEKKKTTSARKRQTKAKKSLPPSNHLITEYFQVTTRKRKTSKDLKEEEDRNIIYHLDNDIDPITMLAIHEFEGKGRGIIALNSIPKGSFICEYRGDLIQIGDAKQREKEYEQQNKGCYMYYFSWNNRQWCIDSTEDTGRYGRLINHSRKAPNCKSRLFILNDIPHLIFIALNDIKPKTELLYDYGDTRRVALESHPWLKDS